VRTAMLVGAFGQSNPGDDALLDAFLSRLTDHRVVAVSSAPAETAARHGCEAVARDDRVGILRAIRRADAVVVAGGTVFKRLPPAIGRRPDALLASTLALVATTRLLGKPLALVGVGAGDLSTASARRLARAVVRHCELLIVRDEESAITLEDAGAPTPFRVGADMAWTLFWSSFGRERPDTRQEPRVVVALSRHATDDVDALGRMIGDALKETAARHAGHVRIELQPWEEADRPLARAISSACPSSTTIAPPETLLAARQQLVGAHVLVGLRFHSLVAAAVAGVPFVALAHEAKLAGLARRLEQPALLLGPDSLSRLPAAIEAASRNGAPDPDLVEGEVRAADESFRVMRLLLDRGVGHDLTTLHGLPLVPSRWPS
jgi:polysaccharide pyruvyl transferase CsaB